MVLIYVQLKEQNLFLIQNAQESEESLEELRAKFRSAAADDHSSSASSCLQMADLA